MLTEIKNQRSSDSAHSRLTEGAKKILLTAERLIAEQGLGGLSTRMIARESGQKNTSALHYHFGNFEGLIESILKYRITPVNNERLKQLDILNQQNYPVSVPRLVKVFVEPFALELLNPPEETYYVSLLAQLYASQRGRELYLRNRERSRSLHAITTLLIKALQPMSIAEIHLRLQLMGRLTITTIAEWDDVRRASLVELDRQTLIWRSDNLIDFIARGLSSKHLKKND